MTRRTAVGQQIAKLIWKTYTVICRFGRWTWLANIHVGKSTVGYLADRIIRRFVVILVGSHGHREGPVHSPGEAWLGAIEMALGEYEPMTSRIFQRCLKAGMVVLDVGAHVGHYTLLSAAAVGVRGHVYSFEPHPANFGSLTANIAAIGYKNISAFPYAVADVEGESLFYMDPSDSVVHSMYPRTMEAERIRVRTVALAPFLEQLGVRYVDAVKMDIEGAEPLAVEGLRPLLETRKVGVLVVEFAPQNLRRAGKEPAEFLRQLDVLGMEIFAIDDVAKTIAPLSVRLPEKLGHRQLNLLCLGSRGMLAEMGNGRHWRSSRVRLRP